MCGKWEIRAVLEIFTGDLVFLLGLAIDVGRRTVQASCRF